MGRQVIRGTPRARGRPRPQAPDPSPPPQTALFRQPLAIFLEQKTWQQTARALSTRLQASPRQLLPATESHFRSALCTVPACGIQGWPEPKPSPGSEVTAQRVSFRKSNLSFLLQSLLCLLLWDFFCSDVGLWFTVWVFGEYSLFLRPSCPAPSPAFLENQSSLFPSGRCQAEGSGIRAAQVQVLVWPFSSFTYWIIQPTNTQWAPMMYQAWFQELEPGDLAENKPKVPLHEASHLLKPCHRQAKELAPPIPCKSKEKP